MKLTRLKTVMEAEGIRSEDLAAKTGLSINTIQKAKGGKDVSVSTQTSIANQLKVKKDELS